MGVGVDSPGTLTGERDILLGFISTGVSTQVNYTDRVTAERRDILAHPVDAQALILQSEVLLLAITEAEDVQAIVDRHKYYGCPCSDRVCHHLCGVYTRISFVNTVGNADMLTADLGRSRAERDDLGTA